MKELKTLLFVLFFILSPQLFAQQDEERLIQLSGIVVSSDSLEPMPFCNIYNKTTKSGTVGDYYGYFSIVSRPNDTLIFSYVGFKVNAYIIPDTLSTFTQGLVHLMERDTITGNTVTVYPWPSKEEFANAFITMNPYEDDIHRVQRELSGKNLAMLAKNLPSDAGLSYSWQQQQNLNMLYNQGHRPVSNLLNPIAWMQFIKAWKDGKFKRDK